MMWRWALGGFRYRRRRRAVISILAFSSVILLLRFEFDAIQANPERAGDLDIHVSSRHQKESPHHSTPLKNDKQYRVFDSKNRGTVEDTKLPCMKLQEKPRFREIDKGTLVYSVWFDDRKVQYFIRILLLTSTRNPLPSLTCHFESAFKEKIFTTVAHFYQHNENHLMRYGGFIVSCTVPQELDNRPCFVNISIKTNTKKQSESKSVAFPVGLIDDQLDNKDTDGGKYGICVPPVFGDISIDKLIEFLELSQILGASHITFYDLAMTKRVRNVLNYYHSKGLVSILAWNLPSYIGKHDLHYFGQVLSIMDCLFRSMRHLRFVAFNDLDEFIVPLRHDNMIALLEEIHMEEHCGHCFQSVIFELSTDHEPGEASPLLTQRVVHRTSRSIPFWTKCVVDPRRIFEQGIHHISKPIEERYHTNEVDWKSARVFHYRHCQDSRAPMQPRCSGLEVDETMRKFGQELLLKFHLGMNALNERRYWKSL